MKTFGGWQGKRLRIDLSKEKAVVEELPLGYLRKWIGGRGMGSEVVYHETWAGMDPLDPQNPLCFSAGPLVGTFAPLAGRCTVSARSPMNCSPSLGTNVYGHGDANMGGQFGAAMKYAGYDQIVIKGRASKPVYIWIDDDHVEFKDAKHLWGLNITEATRQIMEELGGDPYIKVATIGPGGENLVRYALVENSYHSAAARAGMGTVMGSKNLKAVAIRGTKPVELANPDKFEEAAWEVRERIHKSPSAIRRRDEGTLDLFDAGNQIGINAHKNFSTGYMPGLEQLYGGLVWNPKYLFRRKGCWSCPVSCGRSTLIKEGRFAGFFAGGPEMEPLCALGPRLDITDVDAANVMCAMATELGIDAISAGSAMAWATEALERGYLTENDTDGLRLKWGDPDVYMELLKRIAYRKGKLGNLLAEGAIRAAEKLGKAMEIVPHNRGMDIISVDPRVVGGFGLGYAVSTRGSDHLRPYSCLEFPGCAMARKYQVDIVFPEPELRKAFWEDFPKEMSEYKPTKPRLVWWSERNKLVADMVGCCCQAIGSWGGAGTWEEAYAPLLYYATGVVTAQELWQAADRVLIIERAHWNREGSGRQDDYHIDRFYELPVLDGPHKGKKISREDYEWALDEYYRISGMDKHGFVTEEKLKELGLEEVIPDIQRGKQRYMKWLEKVKEQGGVAKYFGITFYAKVVGG